MAKQKKISVRTIGKYILFGCCGIFVEKHGCTSQQRQQII
jgi:hypothetical protein